MKKYYETHVTVENRKEHVNERRHIIIWDCFLKGAFIGKVEWRDDRARYEKPWEAYLCDQKGYGRRSGWFDTLYAARRAMLEWAEQRADASDGEDAKSRVNVACLPETDRAFFPTPSEIAGKLFSGIDWRGVGTILEPSAGKGDLLQYAKRVSIGRTYQGYMNHLIDRNLDIDCVEIDPDLQHILVGKGYRVVHDDFLTFRTRKRYDLILMNPPFDKGDLHLLHAMALCENGGQVACILNAETIRNPYTNSRKALAKELRRYNAQIRFIDNAFARAQRKADVDIAIINVSIPTTNSADTSIYDRLKKAREHEETGAGRKDEIAPGDTVERLIREYDLLCESGIELMKVFNGVSPYIRAEKDESAMPIISLEIDGHRIYRYCDKSAINGFLKRARRRYWEELFNIPELRERMTSAMQDEYHATIRDMQDYEFSAFNVQQVLGKIMGQLHEGVETTIMKCFEKLSNEHAYHKDIQNDNIHYYNGWKTNKAHRVNRTCIIPTWGCFAKEYKPDKKGNYRDVYTHIDANGCFRLLDDLEKALDYLDKGETPRTNLAWALEAAARAGRSSNIECKYFSVTFYKKGTCHIRFRDERIVDRLNIYAGRKKSWLPPTYGKVSYKDMDDESRRVVDEFMGKDHYESVMSQPAEYLIETASSVPLLTA